MFSRIRGLGPVKGRTCLQCAGPLFSQRRHVAFERACCRVPFHKHCIGNAEMERCPSCRRSVDFTESPLLWIPVRKPEPPVEVVVIDDSDDGDSDCEPSAKSQKVDQSFSCIICLEQGTPEDRLMTTDCCNQSAHVQCLRRYYEVPVTCRSKKERDKRVEKLGLPDCFVCRGERGSRPLTWNILKAIVPRVDGSYDANLVMMKFQGMLRRLVDTWLKPWKYMLALDAGKVAVRFADGSEKSNHIPRTHRAEDSVWPKSLKLPSYWHCPIIERRPRRALNRMRARLSWIIWIENCRRGFVPPTILISILRVIMKLLPGPGVTTTFMKTMHD